MHAEYLVVFRDEYTNGKDVGEMFEGISCVFDCDSRSWVITMLKKPNRVMIPCDVVKYIVESPLIAEEHKA